jgi:hypothetical protein
MLAMISHPVFWFTAGLLSAVITYISFRRYRIFLAARRSRRQQQLLESQPASELPQQARTQVELCQKRLLLQPKLNPDWIEPLRAELPILVSDIAKTFHPDSPNPLLAPGIGEFSRAVELTAGDVATFLQATPHGRILNVSANTAQRTFDTAKNFVKSKHYRHLMKWYKRARPLIQVIRYKSLIMWLFLLGRNSAVRALHLTIVGIVGRRAIELYSGNLK